MAKNNLITLCFSARVIEPSFMTCRGIDGVVRVEVKLTVRGTKSHAGEVIGDDP
jgi:hypothetical protein